MHPFVYFILGVSLTLNIVLFIDYIRKASAYKALLRKVEDKAFYGK